uniref:GG18078 n=1 Tax=Drosophila erecta TaxID=7220 RepID=B3NZG1_DROER
MFAHTLILVQSNRYFKALQPIEKPPDFHCDPLERLSQLFRLDCSHRSAFPATATQTTMLEWPTNCLTGLTRILGISQAIAVDTRENLNTAMDK